MLQHADIVIDLQAGDTGKGKYKEINGKTYLEERLGLTPPKG
jgi:hypothetical protein